MPNAPSAPAKAPRKCGKIPGNAPPAPANSLKIPEKKPKFAGAEGALCALCVKLIPHAARRKMSDVASIKQICKIFELLQIFDAQKLLYGLPAYDKYSKSEKMFSIDDNVVLCSCGFGIFELRTCEPNDFWKSAVRFTMYRSYEMFMNDMQWVQLLFIPSRIVNILHIVEKNLAGIIHVLDRKRKKERIERKNYLDLQIITGR